MNFSDQIREVDKLVTNGHYVQAVVTAGSLLEALLKTLYSQVFPKLPPAEQQKVIKWIETIGRGKVVNDFTLGQLLNLFRETQLFEQSQAILSRNLPHLRRGAFQIFDEFWCERSSSPNLFPATTAIFATEGQHVLCARPAPTHAHPL